MFRARQRTLCLTVLLTGCRLVDALRLTADDVNLQTGYLRFRKTTDTSNELIRVVSAPPELLGLLDWVHNVRHLQASSCEARKQLLWPICRMTAWRWIQIIMEDAGIERKRATVAVLRRSMTGCADASTGERPLGWLAVERDAPDETD
jgi:integrase